MNIRFNSLTTVVVLFLVFAVGFAVWQDQNEHTYRVAMLHNHLQSINRQVGRSLQKGEATDSVLAAMIANEERRGLRLTLIDSAGHVFYDSETQTHAEFENHKDRKEVADAFVYGNGFDICRESETLGTDYFYSATLVSALHTVVRSALPYDTDLSKTLASDMRYVWFALAAIIAATLIFIYARTLWQRDSSERDRDKLLAHLRIAHEGLAVFTKDGSLMLSNKMFGHYINIISDSPCDVADTLTVPEIKPFADFVEKHNDAWADESCKKMTISKNGSILEIGCVVFSDGSFEISISDITKQEEQSRLKAELTQNIAHELKTPVASISGYLETIISNKLLPEETKNRFIEHCYSQSQRLSNLMADISMLNKINLNPQGFEKIRVDIGEIVDTILNETALRAKKQGMVFRTSLPQYLTIMGNHSMLYSIFRNLTDNALAYAGQNTIVDISCYATSEKSYSFCFSDNGMGVGEEHLQRLFERFYRVDKGRSRALGGTGLGLAIVKNAVAFHGGTIVAKNRMGGGLEFLFTLNKE